MCLVETLCDNMNYVHGIFQVRILEQVAIPIQGDPPNPGIKPVCLAFPALAGRFFNTMPPGKPRSTSSDAYRVDTHINHDGGAVVVWNRHSADDKKP